MKLPAYKEHLYPLKIWWVPQIPMKAFEVKVSSLREAQLLIDTLADYDQFQYDNRVKPDYSNVGGIAELQDDDWLDVDEDYLEELINV